MKPRITVVGSLNMDLIVRSPRIPLPGETIIGGEFLTVPSGKGGNQAVAAARAGARVAHIGRVGDDAFGKQLVAGLKSHRLDCRNIVVDTITPTGIALIVVDESSENSIVVAPGGNMQLSHSDILAARGLIIESQVLLLQLEIPIETVMQAARIAH